MSVSCVASLFRRRHLLSALVFLAFAIVITVPATANEALTPRQEELASAVNGNNVEKIRELMADGVEVPGIILVPAATRAKLETIAALIEGGADANAALDLGGIEATALGNAIMKNRADVVALLVDAGARTDAPHMARAPLDWARDGKNPDIIDALMASNPGANKLSSFDALVKAIDDGDHAALREILASGQDPNEMDKQGNAPIHRAVDKRDGEALKLLLGAGADPDKRDAGGRHAAERASGFEGVFEPLLQASKELQAYRDAPIAAENAVYEAGTVVGGPCVHSGRIPLDAGCGDFGTERFTGTRYSTQGWSESVGPPLCAPVTLPPLPGTYTVTVMRTMTDWKGERCYENIGSVYFSKENRSETSEYTFTVK